MNRMNRILSVDPINRTARVETGIVNLEISRGVAEHGLFFAPDPSSQSSCTVGGNIAENAGGPHCFKYGATTAHILSLTVVLPNGEIVDLGERRETVGYDLVGLFIGSEGTFGIATAADVRLLPLPEAVKTCLATFPSMVEACEAVSDIVALGIIPAAVEMMDRATIEVVEAGASAGGFPKDAEAVLLVEFDGAPAGLDRLEKEVDGICRRRGAVAFVAARDAREREKLWKGRKAAFGAMGRLSISTSRTVSYRALVCQRCWRRWTRSAGSTVFASPTSSMPETATFIPASPTTVATRVKNKGFSRRARRSWSFVFRWGALLPASTA
jgi:FAD/FMN-containing dehydrogenase